MKRISDVMLLCALYFTKILNFHRGFLSWTAILATDETEIASKVLKKSEDSSY